MISGMSALWRRAAVLFVMAGVSAGLSVSFADTPVTGAALPSSSAPLSSGQAQQAAISLDLRAAVERALAVSPNLAGAQDALLAAEARRDAALRQYAPSAIASALYTHSGPVEPGTMDISLPAPVGSQSVSLPAPLQDSTSFRLGLQQPIYTGGRIEAGIAAASAAASSARADAASRRRAVAASAEQAWWGLVLAAESEEAVAENLAAVSAHRADAERRLAQGTGTKSELLSWQMQEVEAGVRIRAAATDLAAARARLNILLGLPWDAPSEAAVPPAPDLDRGIGVVGVKDAAAASSAALLDAALSTRPEITAARARISAQDAAEAQARASLLPSVYLTGSLAYDDPNPKAFPQRSGFEFLWDVGVMASIDLGRVPTTLAQIADARAQAAQARELLGQTRDALTLELVQARFDLEKARDRFDSSTAAVSLAQENQRVQNDRFAAGLAIASELADAEASLLAAKLDRFRSRVAWELARAALRDAAGGDAASELAAESAQQPQAQPAGK